MAATTSAKTARQRPVDVDDDELRNDRPRSRYCCLRRSSQAARGLGLAGVQHLGGRVEQITRSGLG